MTHSTNRSAMAIALALAAGFSQSIAAADLVISLGPIQKQTGQLMLALYDSKKQFRKTPTATAAKAPDGDEMQITFSDLNAGKYAVMVFHDVNDNGKLDTNLIGLPKEPWGGSLQGKSLMGPPKWSDTVFSLPEGGLTLSVKLN